MIRFNISNLKKFKSLGFCFFLCFIVAFLFWIGAPTGGAFSWPDSPRHALNGAFVMDLILDAPFNDPVGYAYNYYSQYPALTILFYPQLLSFLLAPFYAVFGVSQETALFVLFICYSFLAFGVYYFSRLWLSASISFGVALTFVAFPEIAYWGRQVMLEIPAFAFLVWSAYFLIRHIQDQEQRISFLYISIALLVLAAYTKLSIIFIFLPYLAILLYSRGLLLFRNKHSYIILTLCIIGILPLVYLTLEFGQANIQSVTGLRDSVVSRLSIEGWSWYAKKFPSQTGWPALIAALLFLVILFWPASTERPKIQNIIFLISWLVVGYIFFSAFDLKEARHSLFLLLPIALFVGFLCQHIFQSNHQLGPICVILIGIVTLGITLSSRQVHYVDGYKDVVNFISKIAPQNSNVLFSGYRDGAFIFDMRAYSDRPDISVLRADKLLLEISVRRSLGVKQKNYSEKEISDLIDKMGVHYIVAQPDFWIDLDQMKKLQNVLHSKQFKEVQRFKMISNYNSQEKELVVYRNLGNIAQGPIYIENNLPVIGRSISGISKGNR